MLLPGVVEFLSLGRFSVGITAAADDGMWIKKPVSDDDAPLFQMRGQQTVICQRASSTLRIAPCSMKALSSQRLPSVHRQAVFINLKL
jgi:hypothetical protein